MAVPAIRSGGKVRVCSLVDVMTAGLLVDLHAGHPGHEVGFLTAEIRVLEPAR